MSEKYEINDLSSNLIAIIFQYLPIKDMFMAAKSSKKFYDAFKKDFLMEQIAKKKMIFLPSDEVRGETWKDILEFLNKLEESEKSGKPSKYKMTPYRGHKAPIEAVCALENLYNFDTTIVSGDSDGNLFTWNLEVDEDDEDEKIMVKDLIVKLDSKIQGIEKFNNDQNIIVWTEKNKFYIYNVNLYQSPKFDKNSKRFELKSEFNIDIDDNIKQIYYDKNKEKLFLSPDLRGEYNNPIAYSYSLKTLTLEIFNFRYDNIQADFVIKDESANQGNANANNNNLFGIIPQNNFIDRNHVNCFEVCGDKLVFFLNYEPVRKQLIRKYSCKKLLPNAYFIDEETKLYKDLHIDLDYIYNIVKISEDKVAFIGLNSNNLLSIKIYSTDNLVLLGESILNSDTTIHINEFNLLYSGLPEKPELNYLINNKILYHVNLANFKQIRTREINKNLKDVSNVTCIESDRHRIVFASDDLYISIFDITNGEFWYNFLGGSLSVVPSSYVKHPSFEGFHLLKISRNAIIAVMGNLIRKYSFTFKKK